MPTSVIEHIRTVVADGVGLRDGELLGRYVDRRDEAALAALVHRHAPMVWGVCRRQLSHHDAEDAFQATFIVLVHKAASIAQREAVGNWLYGVAHQAALQARRSAARRRAREVQVTEMPDAEAPQEQRTDLQPFLDEELSRLPDHYRTVIVLSDLEGRTRKEVAAQLGCPEGTVASRLVRARSTLAKRLTKRGVALSGGALAAVLSQSTGSAGVPAAVVISTIKAASLCAAGQAAIPVKVAALAEGVLKAMLLNKLKPALAVLVVVAMVGLIGYGMARGQQKGDAVQKQESEPKAQKDAVVKENAVKEDAIAWGKEVDGLQAGLAAESITCRQGEQLKLAFKLRNVGKTEVTADCGFPREWVPQVTTDTGGQVKVYPPPPLRGFAVPIKLTLKPGETITVYNHMVFVEPEDRAKALEPRPVAGPMICVAPGKYKIAYGGMILPKLATGTVEFEVKEPAKPAAPIKDNVAWGKEVDGLQAGIAADSITCRQGEKLKLTVKLRNVGKAEVTITYRLLEECAPQVTNGGEVSVFMPAPKDYLAVPIKRVIKPGETITLYNPEVAVEAQNLEPLPGPVWPVSTPTIWVSAGK
ncbi:MAG TPA: sigma-70 family RNA polymerase sigma factor, partial [Gemmataceae bacterium]|nr:sigma-70 family RNA polymerase sigma factor [Gemmataceae bacterium]